jgi:hypothetical protein
MKVLENSLFSNSQPGIKIDNIIALLYAKNNIYSKLSTCDVDFEFKIDLVSSSIRK